MGTKITAVGTKGPWNSRIMPPVTDGLELWIDADTSVDRLGFNRALRKDQPAIVGTPIAGSNFIVTSNTGYAKTSVRETPNMTIFSLARVAETGKGSMLLTNFQGAADTNYAPGFAASFGSGIYVTAAGDVTYNTCRSNESGGVTSGGLLITGAKLSTEWAIRVLRINGNASTAFDKTANVQREITSPYIRIPCVESFHIGTPAAASSRPTYTANSETSQAIIYSRALSNTEVDAVVAQMRKRAGLIGLSV